MLESRFFLDLILKIDLNIKSKLKKLTLNHTKLKMKKKHFFCRQPQRASHVWNTQAQQVSKVLSISILSNRLWLRELFSQTSSPKSRSAHAVASYFPLFMGV